MESSTQEHTLGSGLRLFPVPIDSIDSAVLQMDVYLRPSAQGEPVLYRSVGVEFTDQDRSRLSDQGIQFLYVPTQQHGAYRKAFSERLDKLFLDPEQNGATRAQLIRDTCSQIITEALVFPDVQQSIEALSEIGQQFAEWSQQDEEGFANLLDMAAHDFYTATHLVNVGVGCGLLIKELAPDEPEKHAVFIRAGMLHDLGKRGIPEEILNHEGKLPPDQWELIANHPRIGYQILREQGVTEQDILDMIRDHHERLDGTGYPRGLRDEHISLAARVCAVVDVFDAICGARPYRGPTPPVETLRIMRDGVGKHFDEQVFETWAELVERLITTDPQRALPPSDEHLDCSLEGFQQRSENWAPGEHARDAVAYWADERRTHVRYPCNISVRARMTHQGKECPVPLFNWLHVAVADISRSGLCIHTPFAMTINDVVELELPAGAKGVLRRSAQVVRVRELAGGVWMAGMRFIET
jgi:HD-GYP domain-containing protein (c-di-GMP phosphodiesterase class II)